MHTVQFESELHSRQLVRVQDLHLSSEVSSHVPFCLKFNLEYLQDRKKGIHI